MTRRYVWRGTFVDRTTGEPMLKGNEDLAAPRVMSDLPAYRSPLGDGVVEGRAARREHLKRNGCREVDPSEFRPSYINPDFAARHGLPLDADGAKREASRRAEWMRERLADQRWGDRS